METALPASADDVAARLGDTGYLSDDALATVAFLALRMQRPLLLEGEPGTGKTALAEALAEAARPAADPAAVLRGHRRHPGALRLGLPAADPAPARARGGRRRGTDVEEAEKSLYDERFLLARPVLQALRQSPAVLLVDEVDRADDEFEAFLLEVLSTYQVTHPRARHGQSPRRRRSWCSPPTGPASCTTPSSGAASTTGSSTPVSSARWRSSGAGRPRCPSSWPAGGRRRPAAARRDDLLKPPGVAETLDWARALDHLGAARLDLDRVARPSARW